MAVDALAQKIDLLLTSGSLAYGRLTAKDRSRLQSLFATGVLEVARSGAGKTVVVKNKDALDHFILRNYPSGLQGRKAESTPRSRAVANCAIRRGRASLDRKSFYCGDLPVASCDAEKKHCRSLY